jgi:hypothetical protein
MACAMRLTLASRCNHNLHRPSTAWQSVKERISMMAVEDAQLKPKMHRRGMFHMKHVTVELATKYEDILGSRSRHRLIGYLYEVCNLSDGTHTLAEIQRVLGHELWPVEMEILGEMVRDMERLDYLSLSE